ncbi:MAG: hypothetical protein AAGJ87_11740, partial [Pseudomonadota bacterium]
RAATLAEERGGADNLALAARALNAVAYFEPDRKKAQATAKKAQDYAEAALAIDPAHVESRLQAAIAMAVRGSTMAPVRAFFLRLPTRSRRHIDGALALDDANAWALSTSAAWRLEVARRGGGGVYGADPSEGYGEFLRARALDPENLVIAYECALRLLASGRDEWRMTALDALSASVDAQPANAFEAKIKGRAVRLAAAVEAGRDAEAAFIEAQR